MRGSYTTDLKQDKDGAWYRWLGTDQKGTKQKFRLVRSKSEASRRIKLIQQLHDMQSDLARDQQTLDAGCQDTSLQQTPSLTSTTLADHVGHLLDAPKIGTCMAWLSPTLLARVCFCHRLRYKLLKPEIGLPD
jgi:hypothetical protein